MHINNCTAGTLHFVIASRYRLEHMNTNRQLVVTSLQHHLSLHLPSIQSLLSARVRCQGNGLPAQNTQLTERNNNTQTKPHPNAHVTKCNTKKMPFQNCRTWWLCQLRSFIDRRVGDGSVDKMAGYRTEGRRSTPGAASGSETCPTYAGNKGAEA